MHVSFMSAVLWSQVDDLESLEVREEANVDGVLVRGNHFLHVSREKPFNIHANDRTVFTGTSRGLCPARAVSCIHSFLTSCNTKLYVVTINFSVFVLYTFCLLSGIGAEV